MQHAMSKMSIMLLLTGILFIIAGYWIFNFDVPWKDRAILPLIGSGIVFFILGGFSFWNDRDSSDV